MYEAADRQGASLTDWFDEQIAVSLPQLNRMQDRAINEITDPNLLMDSQAIFRQLADQDWAFTKDSTRYFTHDLHPYPAKFIPQIPANLISQLSLPGDIVCDPFGGSATTAVEAVRLGRRAISLDANPLGALIGRVKTGFMSSTIRSDIDQLSATVEGHIISPEAKQESWAMSLIGRYKLKVPDIPNIDKWFVPNAIGELASGSWQGVL